MKRMLHRVSLLTTSSEYYGPVKCFLCLHLFYLFIFSLYRGKVALEVAEAQHLMEGLDWQGAIKDIQASVKWLKENGSPKVVFFI